MPNCGNGQATLHQPHLFISAITVLELEQGVLQKERRDSKQGALLRSWLTTHVLPAFSNRVLPVDTAVAQQCARLHVPDPRSERDALIGATAIVHGLTLVTRNTQDFALMDGLALFNPWE
jgi:predicted nucleic acid-binding protein